MFECFSYATILKWIGYIDTIPGYQVVLDFEVWLLHLSPA